MKRLGFCFGFAVGLAVSCATQKPASDEQHSFTVHNLSDETKMAVVERGDLDAFESLIIGYLNSPFPGEILPYALLMAHRHGHRAAYYEAYDSLAYYFYRDDAPAIDVETANLAVRFLLLAAEAGHEQAIEEVKRYEITYDEATNQAQVIRLVEGGL